MYPHGVGVVVTIYLTCNALLPDTVTLAIGANQGRWKPDDGSRACTLQELAQTAMKRLRQQVLGNDGYVWEDASYPDTVTTFIDVEGAETSEVEDGGMIHKALEALCLWSKYRDWDEHKPTPIGPHCFKLSEAPNHVSAEGMGNTV